MFFKKLRSKSSSKSTREKSLMSRITSHTTSSPSHNSPSHNEKIPQVTISSPTSAEFSKKGKEREGEEKLEDEEEQAAREFQEFLAKAKQDAERKERETARSILRARETNLSPWAGRISTSLQMRRNLSLPQSSTLDDAVQPSDESWDFSPRIQPQHKTKERPIAFAHPNTWDEEQRRREHNTNQLRRKTTLLGRRNWVQAPGPQYTTPVVGESRGAS
ncbi:hypothetical protein BDZ45DRAFT_689890 [Acephala macrosclerotiorum]|nr:hypothetical protein BDZ45DRAFT_689890 [Acephala macrosclerotiorum]